MKLMPGYFVVLTQYKDYNPKRGPHVGRKITNSTWAVADSQFHLAGIVAVFEREDAARHGFNQRGEMDSPKTIHQLWFIRAFFKRGAASKAIEGRGEILAVRSLSREEVELKQANQREEEVRRSRADVVRYRNLIEATHRKNPKLPRDRIPDSDSEHPSREQVYLDRYAIGLYRCGALTSREMDLFHETLETGYSDHRQSTHYIEIVKPA